MPLWKEKSALLPIPRKKEKIYCDNEISIQGLVLKTKISAGYLDSYYPVGQGHCAECGYFLNIYSGENKLFALLFTNLNTRESNTYNI